MEAVAKILRSNRPSNNSLKNLTNFNKRIAKKPVVMSPLAYKQGDQLPFSVTRTKLSKNLPVYTEIHNPGIHNTIVRRIRGDPIILAQELKKVCEGAEVQVRKGSLEVNGSFNHEIRKYLEDLGF
ncbi:hypothetical protein WA158_002611 [Blastocystis sp. Blastoise]